ncbi:MAG: biotin/lipoyl-binding protein [Candidatus Gracilibacteria bacterium]|nr:biotin/lipoyl-binding protein [Candidatus Gracilibacteria bacterium]
MKKNIFILGILLSLVLSSCGSDTTDTTTLSGSTGTGVTKTPFLISTLKVSDTLGTVEVEKTSRITASSSLTLTSQGAGEIGKLLVKEGQKIKAGTTIAVLKDTINNFDLRLAQAENTVTMQDATIATTKINLDQAVENARIGLERAQQSYDTLTDKNAIQYDTLVNSNGKTLDAYNQNYKSYISDVDRLMTQLLFEGDKILGITTTNEHANDNWEHYLGVHNGDSYALAKEEWGKMYEVRGAIRARMEKGAYLQTQTINDDLELVGSGYTELQKFTDAMILMIQNNLIGAGLSTELQSGWVTAWNTYKGLVQSGEATFNGWKSQTTVFFKSYQNSELATKLALASLSRNLTAEENAIINGSTDIRVNYESARIDLKDKITNAKLSLDQAQLAYNNALKSREATLTQLDATKRNSQIALDQARRDYAKLSISAPVDGTVTKMIANVGQTVNAGSAIAEFSGKQPQIVVDVDSSLASSLGIGNTVNISVDNTTLTGTVTAVSHIANANLLSTIRIAVQDGEKYIGKSASIRFTSIANNNSGSILLPINAVKIISEEEGEISLFSPETGLMKKTVTLGQVNNTSIEVFGQFNINDAIITTDISNYDELRNTLTLQ